MSDKQKSGVEQAFEDHRKAQAMKEAADVWVSACAFCGHSDHRHRIVDAVRERIEAGEPEAEVLADYGLTVEQFEAICGDGERCAPGDRVRPYRCRWCGVSRLLWAVTG